MKLVTKTPVPTSLAEKWIRKRFALLRFGSLVVHQDGQEQCYGDGDPTGPAARIDVHSPAFWDWVLRRGNVGAGEAYAKGLWGSPDPADVVRLFVRNEAVLQGMDRGLAVLSKPILGAYHFLRRNTEAGSKANIEAHYDLSNEFFALFLDPTMTYSCGLFETARTTMEEASVAKLERICRKLDLQPSDHLLEIGTGWGSMAMHAAREYGCRVTTTTISERQFELANERVRAAGLADRITIVKQDYRRLEGQYDKLVSVEMIEAIGHQYFGEFFAACSRLLKPDGLMCLQSITIADQFYDEARRSVDFIKRYIFPGCCIPAISPLTQAMAKSSDLRVLQIEDIGPHYARTLAIWRENLQAHGEKARALGFDDEFLRLWEFYFAYCEGGFAERRLSDVQMLLARPAARPESLIPELPRGT